MTEIASSLDAKLALYRFGSHTNAMSIGLKEKDLNAILADATATPPIVPEKGGFNDKLLYIYTSGTTGLPKAAIITNARYISSVVCRDDIDIEIRRVYVCYISLASN